MPVAVITEVQTDRVIVAELFEGRQGHLWNVTPVIFEKSMAVSRIVGSLILVVSTLLEIICESYLYFFFLYRNF